MKAVTMPMADTTDPAGQHPLPVQSQAMCGRFDTSHLTWAQTHDQLSGWGTVTTALDLARSFRPGLGCVVPHRPVALLMAGMEVTGR